ncbi:MAG TPA: PEGA domain-containing protein [Vicinamibacterales bacterium]|nr:PEGA domain-containing protein [Vicinamibacterales bacterium]
MDPALVSAATPVPLTFGDGLGDRHLVVDRGRNEPVEMLCLRGELTAVPSFEFALRERVSRLAAFRHTCYAHVRTVERLKDSGSTLALVSDATTGVRLSRLLEFAEQDSVTLDIDAALCLLRQLVPAVALLHEHAPDVSHGAIAAERVIVTPGAHVMLVEHVLGSALEQLRFPIERYWKDLRVALPRTTGAAQFDQRADVTQLGVIALALILGRPIASNEYPSKLGEAVSSAWAMSASGGLEPLPAGLRNWLACTLQLDRKNSFESAVQAQEELERVLGESDYMAAPATLEEFLAQYRATHEPPVVPVVAAAPAPTPAPVVATPIAVVNPPPAPTPFVTVTPATTPFVNVTPAPAPVPLPVVVPEPKPAPVASHAPAPTPKWVPDPAPAAPPKASVPPPPAASVAEPVAQRAKSSDEPVAPPARTFDKPVAPPARIFEESVTPYEIAFGEPDTQHETSAKKFDFKKRWPIAAAAVALLAIAGAGIPAVRHFGGAGAAAPTAEGTLTVNTNPPGAKVFVDGVERGMTPLSVALKPGTHALELRGDGTPRLMPITVTAGAELSQYIELPKTAATFGQLQVRTEPAGARVSVDGLPRGTSPVTVGDLTPGEHAVQLESDFGAVKQIVTVEAGLTASLMVPLAAPEGSPVSGWMSVTAPADVQIFENKRLIGTSQSDRLMVSAGKHDIEIVNDLVGYRTTRTVQVAAGKVTPVKVEFPKGNIALNAVPWAEVWVDGEKIGETPIGNLSLSLGAHEVVFRHPELGEQRHAALVTLKTPARLSVDLRKK